MFSAAESGIWFEKLRREHLMQSARERIRRVVVPIGACDGKPRGERFDRARTRAVDFAGQHFANGYWITMAGEKTGDGRNELVASHLGTNRLASASADTNAQLCEVLAFFKRHGTKKNIDGMARYAIVAKNAYGVSVGDLRDLARRFSRRSSGSRVNRKTNATL